MARRKTINVYLDREKLKRDEDKELERRSAEARKRFFHSFNIPSADASVEQEHEMIRDYRQVLLGEMTAREHRERHPRAYEERAGVQSVGSNVGGGHTVPTEVAARIAQAQLAYGGLRRTRARVVPSEDGRTWTLPGVDDTGNAAVIVSEGSTVSSAPAIPFSAVTLDTHMYQAGPIVASLELIQDTAIDVGLGPFVLDALGTRMGRGLESDLINLSSTATGPVGLVNFSTGAVSIASSTALTLGSLRSLMFSVDPAYRQNAEWGVSDDALQTIMALEDQQGRPLVEPDQQAGRPLSLYGYPLRLIPDLPSINTGGGKAIWFGDWSYVWLRDVAQIGLQVLVERYAEKRQRGFITYRRHGGGVILSSTIPAARKPLRCIRTST